MKMISLCAGKGTRMKIDKPKCLLPFGNRPILYYQIKYAKELGIEPIIVKGYKGNLIDFNVKSYNNPLYGQTNMFYSLMKANKEFNDDVIVSYGDIIYDRRVLQGLVKKKGDILVTVDTDWKYYWKERYGSTEVDTESLVEEGGLIRSIGKPHPNPMDIDSRYVGLLKFSKEALEVITKIYEDNPRVWRTAYITDLLQELIARKYNVIPYHISNGWLEFDNPIDYEKAKEWLGEGSLSRFKLSL